MSSEAESPANPSSPTLLSRAEWGLLLVFVAIQFTHTVDFVIIMPLGDRLRRELEITPEQFGTVIAAYAWAAGSPASPPASPWTASTGRSRF
jgi:predicted MFS family arabinose efflux permease